MVIKKLRSRRVYQKESDNRPGSKKPRGIRGRFIFFYSNLLRASFVLLLQKSGNSTIMKRILKLTLLCTVLLMQMVLLSCEKDELTEPATVECQFSVETESAMNGLLTIERFDLNLSRLDISGRRTNENDMFFSRGFDAQTGHFQLSDAGIGSTTLQIPQGVYETLVFYLTVVEEEYEFEHDADDEDETADLGEYIQKAKPGILLVGRYSSGSKEFPVIISMNEDVRRLALDAHQDGTSTITLKKGAPSLARISFDPAYWFTSITPDMLESATTYPLDGEEAVFIGSDYNGHIYDQIAGRIQGSATHNVEHP